MDKEEEAQHFATIRACLSEAKNLLEQLERNRPALRVLRVTETVNEPAIPAHTCGDECSEGICVVTDGDVERTYNKAKHAMEGALWMMGMHLPWNYLKSYDEMVDEIRARNEGGK